MNMDSNVTDAPAPVQSALLAESEDTQRVMAYWERQSCGTHAASAEKYTRDYFEEIESYRYLVEPFIHGFAQFSRWRDKRVLEVGVGAGTDFLQFVRSGADAHGIDLTEEALRNVQHRLDCYGLNARDLRRCNAEHLPYPDDHFDLVYSYGVIHHAADTPAVLREMVRVAKPGGTVKVMVYGRNSFWALVLWLRKGLFHRRGRDWVLRNFQESYGTKAYTPRTVRSQLLAEIPFTDVRIWSYDAVILPDRRFARLLSLILKMWPERHRWYLCFEFRKP